ncbi:MAG: 7-carboxy-7-deazaguanine synthase QueE [Bacteroidetes bacterium]|nr:7-carboxy-7-deazaguanine synthase QueE [Bacteroidota bacterium]
MRISELFYSLQGEGKRTGVPSFFIRTNFCNLRCRFKSGNLCDTPYTSWNPGDEKNLGDVQVDKIIEEYKKSGAADTVITGGEPSVQKEELDILCRELKKLGAYITLETNGTIVSNFINHISLASVSPKLSTSVPYGTEYEKSHSLNRLNIPALKQYEENFRKGTFDIQWKFVVCGEEDIAEIKLLQKEAGFSDRDVYLMPEGINREDINKNSAITAELCKKYGYNFTGRLHIDLWGGRRGV